MVMSSDTQRTAFGMMAADTDPEGRDVDGLYGPASEAWRLSREAAMILIGGPRSLLLQIAHPLVAEGVDQHSDFRADPWGRLSGTLRSYFTIVYGTRRAARAEIARLGRLHRRVAGPVRDPAAAVTTGAIAYSARDPGLALWVHATLVDSTMVAYDAFVEPLSAERRAAYYAETCQIAVAFGVPDELVPVDVDAFDAYMAAMLAPTGPVHPTQTARALAEVILHPPIGPLADVVPGPLAGPLGVVLDAVPGALVDWTLWSAVGLLPPGLREEFEIPWNARRALVARWFSAGVRFWRPRLPAGFRQMPKALAADRRVARAARGPARSPAGGGPARPPAGRGPARPPAPALPENIVHP
jgi:uncharacterized protein (DUF2236 family)